MVDTLSPSTKSQNLSTHPNMYVISFVVSTTPTTASHGHASTSPTTAVKTSKKATGVLVAIAVLSAILVATVLVLVFYKKERR